MDEKKETTELCSFQSLKTRGDVAKILAIPEKSLRFFLYKIRPENMYYTLSVPKKNGTMRTISAPQEELKQIQRKLAAVLSAAYTPKVCAYGFIAGRSHISNAAQHTKTRLILSLDLKDFFSQIHFGRVRGLLMAPPYSVGEEAATTIAQIACYNGILPQGAPSSPVLTNMICSSLDNSMIRLAKQHGCVYTRYADDLTLSTHAKEFPVDIITSQNGNLEIGIQLKKILSKQNFELNKEKIQLSRSNCHQEVTGLTVNVFPNLRRHYIRNLRAILHDCKTSGLYSAAQTYIEKGLCKSPDIAAIAHNPCKDYIVIDWFKHVLKGKIEYIRQVKGSDSMTFLTFAQQLNDICNETVFDTSSLHKLDALMLNNIFVLMCEASQTQGSGFYLKDIGLITSHHVVSDKEFYKVYKHNEFSDHSLGCVSLSLRVTAYDDKLDYAIFPFDISANTSLVLEAGDSRNLKVGDPVTIIGYPNYMKGDSPYVQTCTITSISKLFNEPFYTVSGRVVHGASGGAVLNCENKVIGILKGGIVSMEDDAVSDKQGFIPLHLALEHMNDSI